VPAGIMSAGYMEEVRRRRAGETGELPPVGDNG
jgi:hypothetical protein